MAKIIVENLAETSFLLNDNSETLLIGAQLAKLDWRQSCGGQGRCTSCQCEIISGAEQLLPLTEVETRFMELGKLTANRRLACQAKALPDAEVRVRIPESVKLPHLNYLD